MRLPSATAPGDVLLIDAAPWCDGDNLPVQTVMVAVNGRLLATWQARDRRVLALRIPASTDAADGMILGFSHLHCRPGRRPAGLYRDGRPLGLSLCSVRVFCRVAQVSPVLTLPRLPGTIAAGSLLRSAALQAGLQAADLVTRFESLGHDCEFGTVQRGFGTEPLGLLRFAGVVTHKLVDALMARFDGIGGSATTRVFLSDPPKVEFKVHDQLYYAWWTVGSTPDQTTEDAVHREQCRRLVFLRRKFLEDLRAGEKIFVLTRGEPITEPEALAVFCALQVEGRNTLLWTVHGDAARAGEVDCTMPGFLCGHLGAVDERNYATQDAWLSVLANAHAMNAARSKAASR